MKRFKAAVVQMRSAEDVESNVERALALVRAAARDGAELVSTPENTVFLRVDPRASAPVQPLDGPLVGAFRDAARELGIWLLLGSFPEACSTPAKAHNTSVLIGPEGAIAASYRKIHLFDVDIPGRETHLESASVEPGDMPVVADTPLARVGLSVCYDLRFPELYRELARQGAELLAIPAAFTLTTGKDHWEVLQRARAIENQCFVLSAAQWGYHGGKRLSYGNALIVDPWGTVLARCGEGEGWASAMLDGAFLEDVRRNMPCASHRRL